MKRVTLKKGTQKSKITLQEADFKLNKLKEKRK